MEPRIFVTSDWHFGHNKEFVYKERGFSSIEEHNETIIRNHNEVVAPNDIIWFCGDAMLGENPDYGIECIKRLNGQIHMIRGNHDTNIKVRRYLEECPNVVEAGLYATMIKKGKYSFYLSHYPTMVGSLENSKNRLWNLAGHTHSKDKFENITVKCYNVAMDAHNCYPVLLDDIVADIKKKKDELIRLAQTSAQKVQ